jgi:hypothetical protein
VSFHADEGSQPQAAKKRDWVMWALLVCLLVTGVAIFIGAGMRNVPEVSGTITFNADPDTRIYVGDKLVGTTKVTVSWKQLLGDETHEPLAIELRYPTNSVTPELISGPGAKILESRNLENGQSPDLRDSEDSYLLRRADGSLDHVLAYVIEFKWTNPPHGYLILVRARKGSASSTISFDRHGGGSSQSSAPGIVKLFGKSPIQMEDFWTLSPYNPPKQFANEINTKGFWEPDHP